MTPREALQSPVFLAYFWIVAGLLGGAGLALASVSWLFKREVRSIWVTYRSWLIMAPLMIACVFAGREVTILGLSLLSIFGFKEFARRLGSIAIGGWWELFMRGSSPCVPCR